VDDTSRTFVGTGSWRGAPRRIGRRRRVLLVPVGLLAAAMVTSLLTVTPVEAKPEGPAHLVAQAERLDTVGGEVKGKGWSDKPKADVPIPAPVWPTAGTATAVFAGAATAAKAQVGKLPVAVARTAATAAALPEVSVEVLDRAKLPASLQDAVVLRVGAPQQVAAAGAAGVTKPSTAALSVNYSAFRYAYGGDCRPG
jgi:hypothetical protein